jgi:GDPmannose 4,6-dehydratase
MKSKKNAIIIGAAGQDGILLTDLLKKMNYEVIPVFRDNLNFLNKNDLNNFLLEKDPNEIYYLASENPSSQDTEELFSKSLNTHLIYMVNLFETILLINKSIKIFCASTSHIFSGNDSINQTEDTNCEPDTIYGVTKLFSFTTCKYFREKYGLFISSGILYNHDSIYRKENFVSKKITKSIARIVKKELTFIELGDIDNKIDWGYAPDFVRAMHAILQLDTASDFIISTGEKHTVREFLKIAFAHVGLNYENHIKINQSIIKKKHHNRCGDNSKLKLKTNWAPTKSFQQMVQHLVDEELILNKYNQNETSN